MLINYVLNRKRKPIELKKILFCHGQKIGILAKGLTHDFGQQKSILRLFFLYNTSRYAL